MVTRSVGQAAPDTIGARRAGARSDTQVVVDADAHVNEDVLAWTSLAERHPGWIQAGHSGGSVVAEIEGKLYPRQEGRGCGVPIRSAINPACASGADDVDRRVADMGAEGIDVQVLYGGLAIGVTSFADAGFAADFARAYNDWLLGTVCAHPSGRLFGVAIVPAQDVARSITELERVVPLGAVGVTIPPVVGATNLDDPSLLPLFEAAAEAGLAVAVHSAPGMNVPLPAAERFDNYAQVHCLSFPVDQMTALTGLVLGGVLDRLPALRVAFLEAGAGWVPYFVHRMHEHHEKRPELLPGLRTDPRDVLARGQCWFSFEADEPLLAPYVEHLGDESLVYASDYPHWDADWPGSVAQARQRAEEAGLDVDAQARVLGGNACALYSLEHRLPG